MAEENAKVNRSQIEKTEVFISYAVNDLTAGPFVAQLTNALREIGVDSITSKTIVKPGEIWSDAIKLAIKECRFLIFFISGDKTAWTLDEWSTIREVLWVNTNIKIIPILIDDAKLPPFLKDRKYSVVRRSSDPVKCIDSIYYILDLKQEKKRLPGEARNMGVHTILVMEDTHTTLDCKDLEQSAKQRYSTMIAAIKQSINEKKAKSPGDGE